jgi:organic hydroperoxide reductase OsmC/OhrA
MRPGKFSNAPVVRFNDRYDWPVARFRDHAVAHLGKNQKGKMSITRIDLHPVVGFDAGFSVEAAKLAEMHDSAHRYCFIAITLAESVEINIL